MNKEEEEDTYTIVDLFCGAGGMSVGFEKAGFEVLAGVDNEESAVNTFAKNHPESISMTYDITKEIPDEISSLSPDGVVGGPPCQGFSDARGSRYVDDDRNSLVFEYIRWINELQPKFAVMENVRGILSISDDFMDAVEKEFASAGFPDIEYKLLDASDYGVPQARKRVILVAYSEDIENNASLPEPTHSGLSKDKQVSKSNKPNKVTSWEAIKDLPEPEEGEIQLNKPFNNYLKWVHSEEDKTYDHITKESGLSDIEQKIVTRLNPGEMYRSTRFGDRYRQVWDILYDEFTSEERDILEFIGNNRSKKDYRIRGKSVGHVDVKAIHGELEHSRQNIAAALNNLVSEGWLRTTKENNRFGYDLNTQSGVRPKYMRLTPNEPSNTITTADFKPREKLHPYNDRGLSLREGARLQSFPDDFEFTGNFDEKATQIGNAVPPRLIENVGQHIKEDL